MRFVKGDTDEVRFKAIDRTLTHFSRRLHKTVVGIVTPYPIYGYVYNPASSGPVIRYLFPCDGRMLSGFVMVDSMPKDGIRIEVDIIRGTNNLRAAMVTKANPAVVIPSETDIRFGDRLSLSVRAASDGQEALGIWTSLLWTPSIKACDVHRTIIDELESVGQKLIEECVD